MDDIRNKYKNGTISKVTYKKITIEKTLQVLHSSGYKFISTLGSGTYGTVIKVKEPKTSSIVALKIILEQDVTNGEKLIWPNLQNPNILSLKSHSFINSTHTFIFKMPALPFSLNQLLNDLNFQMDFRALPRAKIWLKGIISGLQYLHSSKCYHLDLKPNNVLISASDHAVICDFTFLTQTEDFVTNYGSPLIFRPPETVVNAKQRTPVDGEKYDVYTLGLLALEMFSGMSFSKEISKIDLSVYKSNYWCEIIYPCVFGLLAPPNFLFRMQLSFPTSLYEFDTVDNIRNLIVACLNLNPAERPSADQLLEGKFFEGKKFWFLSDKDLWNTPANFRDVHTLMKDFCKQEVKRRAKIKKCVFKQVDKKLTNIGFRNKDSKRELKNSVPVNPEIEYKKKKNETEAYEVKKGTKFKDTDVDNGVEKFMETPVNHLISVIKDKSWASIVGIDYFSDAEVENENKIQVDDVSSFGLETLFHESSLNDKNKLPSQSFNMDSHDSVPTVTSNQGNRGKNQNMNCCQRLRSWWKRGKSVCCQILLRCVPCAKKKTKSSTA